MVDSQPLDNVQQQQPQQSAAQQQPIENQKNQQIATTSAANQVAAAEATNQQQQGEMDLPNDRGDAAEAVAELGEKMSRMDVDDKPSAETFEDMDLPETILRAIYSLGFAKPSRVQKYAVMPHKSGRDVVIQAQSGTGKTLAFALGAILSVNPERNMPQVLVLCHTRELCQQTVLVFKSLLKMTDNIKVYGLMGGGSGLSYDISELSSGKHIIVGTTGRIKHMIAKKFLLTGGITQLILDEADKMLDTHFVADVSEICQSLENRAKLQVCLYSATISDRVLQIITSFMRSEYYQFLLPVKEVALEGIKQYKLCLDTLEERITALLSIADDLSSGTMIIFCNKKDEAKHIFEIFTGNQFPAQLLHGELEQETRQKIMADFRAGNIRQLIATDLIGRGIDVQHVSVVINFGIPNSRDDYIHRIGRSGRFGKKGYAINILSPNDNILLQQYEEHFNFKCDQLPGQIATLLDS